MNTKELMDNFIHHEKDLYKNILSLRLEEIKISGYKKHIAITNINGNEIKYNNDSYAKDVQSIIDNEILECSKVNDVLEMVSSITLIMENLKLEIQGVLTISKDKTLSIKVLRVKEYYNRNSELDSSKKLVGTTLYVSDPYYCPLRL